MALADDGSGLAEIVGATDGALACVIAATLAKKDERNPASMRVSGQLPDRIHAWI
jgi:hypothetical protein